MQKYTYLSGSNAEYIDHLFEIYLKDPASLDHTWRYFFDGLELGEEFSNSNSVVAHSNGMATTSNGTSVDLSAEAKVAELITAYRAHGHMLARLDPLNPAPASHPLLDLSHFGLGEKDLDQEFTAGNFLDLGRASLRKILQRLRDIYCSSIGVEAHQIQDPSEREWLQTKMEKSASSEKLNAEERKLILKRLTESETFERFLHTRYVAQKRFSLEGGESLIPSLDRMIEVGAELGADNFVMGMAHRGRLNVLRNIYGKKAEHILTEFEQSYESDGEAGEGDVKYHMGFSADIITRSGKSVHLSLAHNPSHLEFVNPVVEGITRAKQRQFSDMNRTRVIPILIHGDAAFAGQGVVYETINLSQLEGFWTGGTIHIIFNNQIGFTATPKDLKSTMYATDLGKMLEVPIFHVNGDDPEAVYYVSRLATEYRQKFKKDVFIDLICYRKYGHNEGDEPSFTSPLLYKKIKSHPSVREQYAKKLSAEGVCAEGDSQKMVDDVIQHMTQAQTTTRDKRPKPYSSSYANKWQGFKVASEADMFKKFETRVSKEKLLEYSNRLNQFPSDFHLHSKLSRFFAARKKAIDEGKGIDWGNAETLAYASLLLEGHTIRVSGQDAQRGTFTHRHAVVYDFENGKPYTPLNHLAEQQGEFIAYNSLLSEAGVLGFEYGWSLADPDALVIWEAQFGDFANSAQVIIDQFISSSESKWERASGLVMYLPHGYEGQGPEHSSARLERFLQLGGKNNLAVCNFTTPAQIFHALRRQLKRDFRKPMVIMTPKSLLRHPLAVSPLSDLTEGYLQEIIDDPKFADQKNPKSVKKLILCTGKIFYELFAEREEKKINNIALVRIEQLYPWPSALLENYMKKYSSAEIIWVQEEPHNMGGWNYVLSRWCGGKNKFRDKAQGREIEYVGRDIGAAPAVGSHRRHVRDQKAIIDEALTLNK